MNKGLFVLALCAISATAFAADNGLYVGGGLSSSKIRLGESSKSAVTSYKLIAGARLLRNLGLEVNYADFGSSATTSGIGCIAIVSAPCPSNNAIDVNAKAVTAYAVGFVDLPVLDLFAKLGLSRTDASLHVPGFSNLDTSDKSAKVAWGLGAQAHFASFGVRAEYEQFRIFGDQKVSTVSLSFLYTFL